MNEITVNLGDNSNKDYKGQIKVLIPTETFLALKYGLKVDIDHYYKHWDKLCDIISKRPFLPSDWFIDEIIFD
jgi:hypothetical protein